MFRSRDSTRKTFFFLASLPEIYLYCVEARLPRCAAWIKADPYWLLQYLSLSPAVTEENKEISHHSLSSVVAKRTIHLYNLNTSE